MSDDYFDVLGGIFGGSGKPTTTPAAKSEKGVPWEAKVIDGAFYVPLRQVADLLAANDVLPAVRRGIEERVRAAAQAKQKEQ